MASQLFSRFGQSSGSSEEAYFCWCGAQKGSFSNLVYRTVNGQMDSSPGPLREDFLRLCTNWYPVSLRLTGTPFRVSDEQGDDERPTDHLSILPMFPSRTDGQVARMRFLWPPVESHFPWERLFPQGICPSLTQLKMPLRRPPVTGEFPLRAGVGYRFKNDCPNGLWPGSRFIFRLPS